MCKYRTREHRFEQIETLQEEEKHVKFIIRREKVVLLSVWGKKSEAQQQQIGSDLVKNLRKEMLIFSLANIMGKT